LVAPQVMVTQTIATVVACYAGVHVGIAALEAVRQQRSKTGGGGSLSAAASEGDDETT
jgi:hypothetical protein